MAHLPVELRDTAAITGVGYAPFSRDSGRTVLSLAVEAAQNAISDAGLRPSEIDGIIDFQYSDSATADELSVALGTNPAGWHVDHQGGGQYSCVMAGEAVAAIAAGLASNVLCFRALNGRSGLRPGNFTLSRVGGGYQFLAPFGLEATPAHFAMLCQRHMFQYGTTVEQLGAVAVAERRYAMDNPRAIRRDPMTLDDYLGSRMIAEPFRLLDCCQETDGACAFVVTAARSIGASSKPAVFIRGFASSGGPGAQRWFDHWRDFTETSAHYVVDELWRSAGVGPQDIDVAELYDSFTWTVLVTLEAFGFCSRGEGGRYIVDRGIGLESPLPVNTAGGLLSEGYAHGVNLIAEAVSQLRGECGIRQVENAEIALVTATGGVSRGSALVLRR